MAELITFELCGETMQLHPDRVLYWPARKIMFLADLHLGKASHFRRKGIAVPIKADQGNLPRLADLIQELQPERVLFLGDLFHSEWNQEWTALGSFIQEFSAQSFELVAGNHDILDDADYHRNNIVLYRKPLVEGPFLLTHEPREEASDKGYNLAGHIHPGVLLRGTARQSMRLPCFYFGKHGGILPAFGDLTGAMVIKPKKGDRIFVVMEEAVMQVK